MNISNLKNKQEYFENLPILITGGAGFIGSHLAEKLVELKASVTILDDLSTGNLQNLTNITNKINFIHGSITSSQDCKKAALNQEIVFHLAAMTSVPESVINPEKCNNINVVGTFNMLEACRINNVKKFILSSSSAVYGNTESVCNETTECNPLSPYGYSKLINEIYCKQYSTLFNINTVALRYFNVFGPRQNPNASYAAVVAKFKYQLEYNLPIEIFGDGKQLRDFVPVERVVQANLNLAQNAQILSGEVFNIATGESITLLELVDILKKDFPDYNKDIIFSAKRNGDTYISKASCEKYNYYTKL